MIKTCLVVGNGPSLASVPESFLYSYVTFGSNRVYLKFNPDYYACVNPLVVTQYRKEIADLCCYEKYIDSKSAHLIPDSVPVADIRKPKFSTVPGYVGAAYTVTSVLLQIAYWQGFRRVGLIGVDHRYQFEGRPNQELQAGSVDPNHFDPSYFSNVRWNAPDLERSEMAYRLAKTAFEADGGEIINLTPESALEVFQRENWQTWACN